MKKYLNKLKYLLFAGPPVCIVCLLALSSCKSSTPKNAGDGPSVHTPVSVTTVSHIPLNEYIELNATSTFIQQNFVKSNLNGYIQKSNIKYGDYVHAGEVLFILKTKEARAIGNMVNNLDSTFKFSGVNTLRAGASGYVMQLNHQAGDYIQDGEQLAVISDSRSFVFVMNVPYEDKPYVSIGKKVQLILPDTETLEGTISSSMPTVDSVSQTQSYSIKVNAQHTIPENLIAKVRILKSAVSDAQTLPRQSVLSDQTQSRHWVMKLINDSTAISVPVKTGIEQGDTIQIISPQFSNDTKILLTGNYGLADTASVILSAGTSISADSAQAGK